MITTIIPNDALLFEVAETAAAQHLHIISNGKRTVLSPTIPQGWHLLIVKIKSPTFGKLEAAPL